MISLLLLGAAMAAGLHTGIPVHGVQGLGEPQFSGVDAGWTATVEGGFVRVFVGRTEAEAAGWLSMGLPLSAGQAPAYPFADEAWGDGASLLAFRDGNVGVFVRVERGALDLARELQAAIVDGGPAWPAPAPLVERQGRWELPVADPAGVSFQGGRLVRGPGWVFSQLPAELVVWDAFGRPVVLIAR